MHVANMASMMQLITNSGMPNDNILNSSPNEVQSFVQHLSHSQMLNNSLTNGGELDDELEGLISQLMQVIEEITALNNDEELITSILQELINFNQEELTNIDFHEFVDLHYDGELTDELKSLIKQLDQLVENITVKIDEITLSDSEENKVDLEMLASVFEKLNDLEEGELKDELFKLFNSKLQDSLKETKQAGNVINIESILAKENIVQINEQVIIDEVEQLMTQLSHLLENVNKDHIKQTASQLLPLLRQLSTYINDENREQIMNLLNKKLPREQSELLNRLLTSFQNRSHLAQTGVYKHEAEVTTDDIARWLNEAMNNQGIKLEQSLTAPVRTDSAQVPMSNVEQYVIHINESHRVERIQEQLVRQLETVIKQSRFLQTPNLTQLSLTLQPSHLGNIHVQLMEINGDMTVKMIASSMAAKKMLESNIHQLKHLFAPHNIIIERDDQKVTDVDQLDEQLDEEEEQAMKEKEEKQEKESQEETHLFNENFQDILMNTQVDEEELLDA